MEHDLELPSDSLLTAPETVLQLGFGKFLRGFATDFVQLANKSGDYHGRILSVQRKADYRSEIAARQDSLYTLILRGFEGGRIKEVKRIIGSVSRVLVAETDWGAVLKTIRERTVRVILSNGTETGLSLDEADNLNDRPPNSLPAKIAQLLYERWRSTGEEDSDVAVIPTELVANNGQLLRQLLFEQADRWCLETEFFRWMENSVHVANTLVDRIVVGTPVGDDLESDCRSLGYRDDLVTHGELFYLFVIAADEFTKRIFPINLSQPNIRFVEDLVPFRKRKLRLLNGPQMVLTTLGTLLDFRLIRDVIKDCQIGEFTRQTILEEILPAMGTQDEAVNAEYAHDSFARIGNPNIAHRLGGIRVDLTAKNSIRLLPSIRDFIDLRKQLPSRLLLTLAAMLEVVVRGELNDVHSGYLLQKWRLTDSLDRGSLLAFTSETLSYLATQCGEALDVDLVAPEVSLLFAEIRAEGLRKVLSDRYSIIEHDERS
jgi:tagaturonate reductase